MPEQAYDKNTDYSELFNGAPIEVPDGLSPDAAGGRLPAVKGADGKYVFHLVEVDDFTLELAKNFKGWQTSKDQTCVMGNLHITLRCVEGPYAGMTVNGFLPHPYPGCTVLKEVANKWLNFAVAVGLAIPFDTDASGKKIAKSLLPAGYKPQDLLRKRCLVRVVPQVRNGEMQLDGKGEPFTEPDFFGFAPVGSGGAGAARGNGVAAGAGTPTAGKAAAAQMAATQPVGTKIDIGDL